MPDTTVDPAASEAARLLASRRRTITAVCTVCGTAFPTHRTDAKYCTKRCYWQATNARRPERKGAQP